MEGKCCVCGGVPEVMTEAGPACVTHGKQFGVGRAFEIEDAAAKEERRKRDERASRDALERYWVGALDLLLGLSHKDLMRVLRRADADYDAVEGMIETCAEYIGAEPDELENLLEKQEV